MYKRIPGVLVTITMLAGAAAQTAWAQDHEHEDEGHSHDGLHFTHPLIAESVTPDTKLRLDHQFLDLPDGDKIHVGNLEAEYAFFRSFSIEAGLPYSYTGSQAGNLEVALKFANFDFEDSGILLGYGIEFGFPTAGEGEEEEELPVAASRPAVLTGFPAALLGANSQSSSGGAIGEAEWEIAPFLNIGIMAGNLELVAWGIFGIPFAQEEGEEVETEIEYNISALYHFSPRFEGLLELDGAGGISGHAVGEDVLNLSPGIRVQPFSDSRFVLGTSVGFPLTNEEAFSTRWTTSLFWHF
ncbi:MAG: hypothetical protein ACE5FP_07365 [Gemmatimonadota bacterium]